MVRLLVYIKKNQADQPNPTQPNSRSNTLSYIGLEKIVDLSGLEFSQVKHVGLPWKNNKTQPNLADVHHYCMAGNVDAPTLISKFLSKLRSRLSIISLTTGLIPWWIATLLHNWRRPTLKVRMLSVLEHTTPKVAKRWLSWGQVASRHRASRVAAALLTVDCLVEGNLILIGVFIKATRATVRKIAHSASNGPLCHLVELLVAMAIQPRFRVYWDRPTLTSRVLHCHLDYHHRSAHPSTSTNTILKHRGIKVTHPSYQTPSRG